MATPQQTSGSNSYAEILRPYLRAHSHVLSKAAPGNVVSDSEPRLSNKSFSNIAIRPTTQRIVLPKKELMLRGKPFIKFGTKEVSELLKPYNFLLVGRFLKAAPGFAVLVRAFKYFGLKADFKLNFLDELDVT